MAIVGLVNTVEQQQDKRSVKVDQQEQHEEEAAASTVGYCLKGVRHLCDSGITRLPDSYVLPASDRPGADAFLSGVVRVKLPVVDLASLRVPSERAAVLETLDAACRDYGFFQARPGPAYIYTYICT